MPRPRLLFYAVNGLGLGHVTRLLGIARALRERVAGAEILFVTASEASHIIFREGFAALKVPSRTAAREGRLRRDTFTRLTQSAVWNAMTAFDPHCLVVDTFAAGALHELLPVLRWPMRKVFVFRAQRLERAADPFFQSTLRLYDLILVPHEPGSEEVPVPPDIETVWTGPMVLRPQSDLLPRGAARAALNLPNDGELGLLSLGGGGDPEIAVARRLFQQAVGGLPAQKWVEVAGPLEASSTAEEQESAPQPPGAGNLIQLREVHPLMIYLNAFDYAVCSAGYNTVHELQTACLPAALWPFARDVDDQSARVGALAGSGRVLPIPEGATNEEGAANTARVSQIAAVVQQLQDASTRQSLRQSLTQAPAFNGTARGAEAILRCIGIEPLQAS